MVSHFRIFLVLGLVFIPAECARITSTQAQNALSKDDGDEVFIGVLEDIEDVEDVETKTDIDEENDMGRAELFKAALSRIQSNIDKLAEASKDKASKVWVTVAEYAADVKDDAMSAGAELLEEANMCEPEKRQNVAAAYAAMRSQVLEIAEMAAERWPEVEGRVQAFSKESSKKIVALGKQINSMRMAAAEREEMQNLVKAIRNKYSKIQMAALERTPKWSLKMGEYMAEFTAKVSELSQKVAVTVKDTYEADSTQHALATIQARAGQLLQAAADKWPAVKAMLGNIASRSWEALKTLGAKVGAAMCNPENHKWIMEQVAFVQDRAKVLMTAIVEKLPMVYEGLVDFTHRVAEKARDLTIWVKTFVVQTRESEMVEEALARIQSEVSKLQTSSAAAVQNLREQIGALTLTITRWVGLADLDESESIESADVSCFVKHVKFWPVNMEGAERTVEDSAEACQQRCANTGGCAHFSYWPNGGCHLQDKSAKMRRAWRIVSGPDSCE